MAKTEISKALAKRIAAAWYKDRVYSPTVRDARRALAAEDVHDPARRVEALLRKFEELAAEEGGSCYWPIVASIGASAARGLYDAWSASYRYLRALDDLRVVAGGEPVENIYQGEG